MTDDTGTADAARFLMAVGDADADGITHQQLAELLRTQLTASEILRLRGGCVALLAAIDSMSRRAPRVKRSRPPAGSQRRGAGELPPGF